MQPILGSRTGRGARRGAAVAAAALTTLASAQAGAQCLVRAQAGAAFQELTFGVASANDSTDFGASSTTASYGILTASSNVTLTDTQSDGGSSPLPIAHYEDEFTVTIPSQPGLFSGTMRVALRVAGEPFIELDPGGAGSVHNMNTSYNFIGSRNGGGLYSVSGGRIQATSSSPELNTVGTVPAPGYVEVDFPVVFGVPFTLAFDLISTTGGNQVLLAGQTGFVIGTSNMVFYWDGIVSLDDGSGNDILDAATITSCSGTDWRASQAPPPVPTAPIAPIALLVGAFVVGARRLAMTGEGR